MTLMLTRRTSRAAVPVPAQIASTEQSPPGNFDPIGVISTSGWLLEDCTASPQFPSPINT
jgi:hypothetical protein